MTIHPKAPSILALVIVLLAACAPAAGPSPPAVPATPTEVPKPAPSKAKGPAATAVPAKPAEVPAAKAAPTAAAPAAKPVAAPAGSDAELQTLIEAAKKESNLVVWITTPNLDSTRQALIEAFKQRFGLSQLKVEWVPLGARDASLRVRAEAQAGRYAVDIMTSSLANLTPLVDAGLVAKEDWVGLFGRGFPGVREAGERMVADYAGLGVVHWDIAYVLSYNTDQLKAEEVPGTLEEFADPKWRGRFAINGSGASPFDIMALEWGKDKTLALLKQIIANRPLFKSGSPAAMVAVGQGEAAFGVGTPNQTLTEKDKGAPINWKPMSYLPVLPTYFYVFKNAPSPNAARLFVAWAATEGMKIQEEREYIGRVSDPNSFLSKEIKRMAPSAKVVQTRSLADVAVLQGVTDEFVKLAASG